MKNETCELTKLLENKGLIVSKWLFNSKLNLHGSIENHKARLITKGCLEK